MKRIYFFGAAFLPPLTFFSCLIDNFFFFAIVFSIKNYTYSFHGFSACSVLRKSLNIM